MGNISSLPVDDHFSWTGRNDGPGAEHARWHSVVEALTDSSTMEGAVLLGFASDEGVSRNGGRPGAADGPDELRTALGALALHDDFPRYDAGTINVSNEDLDSGHDRLSEAVETLTRAGFLTVVLGGGHETAFGSHRGLYRGLGKPAGIINLDAHFDLREADRPTSGTPFKQISDLVGDGFDYSVFGISRPNNTRVLFETAEKLGTTVVHDEELAAMSISEAVDRVLRCSDASDDIHLSIDLDVLPAAQAPGVSAPASLGVDFSTIHAMSMALAETGKLRLVDVVELNPKFDIDNRTAKLAARLINDIIATAAKAS